MSTLASNWLRRGFLLAALAGLVGFFVSEESRLELLLGLDWSWFWLVLVGIVANTLARAWVLALTYRPQGVRLAALRWWALGVVSSFMNQTALGTGGLMYRGVFLKQRDKVPFSLTLGLQALALGTNVALAALLILVASLSLGGGRVLTLTSGALVLGFVGMLLVIRRTRPVGDGWVSKIGVGLQRIVADWRLTLLFVVANAASVAAVVVAIWAGMRAHGDAADLLTCAMLSSGQVLSSLASLTPGNIGVQEALGGVVSELAGSGVTLGVSVTLLIRLGNVGFLGLCFWPAWKLMHGEKPNLRATPDP